MGIAALILSIVTIVFSFIPFFTAHLIIKYNASKTISAVPKLIPNS